MSERNNDTLHSFFDPKEQPTVCVYCEQDKPVLFVRPIATSILGELNITLNTAKRNNWTCMECYIKFLTNASHKISPNEI